MELDSGISSGISSSMDIIQKKENFWICCWWDHVEGRLRVHLAMDCYRTRKQAALALTISKERNTFVAERFLLDIVRDYGKCPVSTDGGIYYPMAWRFLGLEHHIHSHMEKSLIERTIQYIKDKTERFVDYFPCKMKNCKMKYIRNRLIFLQIFIIRRLWTLS